MVVGHVKENISQCIILEFPGICIIPSKILTEYFGNPNNNVE